MSLEKLAKLFKGCGGSVATLELFLNLELFFNISY